jgi:hypothetical protein
MRDQLRSGGLRRIGLLAFTALAIASPIGERRRSVTASEPVASKAALQFALHLPFIRNDGQTDDRVGFYARTAFGTTFVMKAGDIVYQVAQGPPAAADPAVLKEVLVGRRVTIVQGDTPAATRVNFFRGNDPARWQSNVPTYEVVDFGEIYDGIRLTLRAGRSVEKIFTVQPGARPSDVRLRLNADRLAVTASGELEASTTAGPVRFTRPVAFQEGPAGRESVDVAYVLEGDQYGFAVGRYDRSRPLIIDPSIFSTYLGGMGNLEAVLDVLHDGAGSLYVAGLTNSADFPGVTGTSPDPTTGGCQGVDAFVAKLDASLGTVLAATFLGGTGATALESARALARNPAGEIYVAGASVSSNFPGVSISSPDSSFAGGIEGFIVRLDGNLSTILSGTFVGGSGTDEIHDLAHDQASGILYAAGGTHSSDFQGVSCPGAADCLHQGREGFVTALDSGLTAFVAGSFLGGSGPSGQEEVLAIAIDPSSHVLVGGITNSPDFPQIGGVDTTFAGPTEGFVVHLSQFLTSIHAATFLGGVGEDRVDNIDRLDDSGGYTIVVSGETRSPLFPGVTQASPDHVINNNLDGFVVRVTDNLATILGGSYIGGSSVESLRAQAVVAGTTPAIYVLGSSFSWTLPGIDGGSADSTTNGHEMFLVKFNANITEILGATFLGGISIDWGNGLALDSTQGASSVVFVGGSTTSTDFPAISGASADPIPIAEEGVIARIAPSLSKPFILTKAAMQLLVFPLSLRRGGDPSRGLFETLERVERHGRHGNWRAAVNAAGHFLDLVDRHRQNGSLPADTARRLTEMGQALIAELHEAERESQQGLASGRRPAPSAPPTDTLPVCPAGPPPPRG